MSDAELLDCTDFQMAGLAWLSIQKMMIDAAQALGPTRAASTTSDELIRDTTTTVLAIASHFRLGLDVDACIASGIFSRHAKSGEPFDLEARAERLTETLRLHAGEIEPVVGWARKVAAKAQIPWDLPYPLLDKRS